MIPEKSNQKNKSGRIVFPTVKIFAKPYKRDGKLFSRAPDTGREVNLSDFTFVETGQPAQNHI
jgi:hypothetical protein